jgi:hypothetical protein
MPLRFEQELVESVVTLHLAGGRVAALQSARFHREREKLYRVLDPDDRNEAFFKLHLEWFCEWKLDQLVIEPVRERPLVEASLTLLAFRSARSRKEEGAELYVNDAGQKHGVIALRPARFRAAEPLRRFLRHEMLHLSDMVDPGFQYAPEIRGPLSVTQQRLARERYRALWDVTIDGRLAQMSHEGKATRAQRREECDLAFPFWPSEKRESVFADLWNNPHPTHPMLESLVRDPRDLRHSSGPGPGAPCPLCAFPTFEWAESAALAAAIAQAIAAEFPHWTAEQGACSRCADVYRLVSLGRDGQASAVSVA